MYELEPREALSCEEHYAMESTSVQPRFAEKEQVKDRFYFRAAIHRNPTEKIDFALVKKINDELFKLSKKYNLSIQTLEFNANY